VISQRDTLALGNTYGPFRSAMEIAPHGSAHSSFDGPINSVPTAAKDPLFFLLHANVDRLWAMWQWRKGRTDPSSSDTYTVEGGRRREPNDLGHKLGDTMWPWNGAVGDGTAANPRPTFPPPRPAFPQSPLHGAPGPTPTIGQMIDWQARHGGEPLGFDYDDVGFELQ
jgi:tyrosinase